MRRLRGAAAPGLVLAALLGCGCAAPPAPPSPAHTAEELLAPWLTVTLGAGIDALRAARPRLEPSGYVSGTRAGWIDTSEPAALVVEIETDDGRVRVVSLEWKGEAGNAAERLLRARLPAPRECSTLGASVEDFKSLLWRLPDGASATAMRKGKTWRLTVSRPPADGFAALFDACARLE
jgi:hypothetical protein